MKRRKLTRKDFAGLRQHYPVLSEEEMRQYIAGHSELYNEQSFFPTNPYIIGMEMEPCSLEQTIKEKTENVDDTNCNIFSSNWNEEVILFSSGYNNYNSNEDWLYHGFGGYDSNGNFYWYSGYSKEEFENWEGDWPGGWVEGWGYVYPDVTIYPHDEKYDYTLEEFLNWQGEWTGGVVESLGYVSSEALAITYDPSKLQYTGVEEWDILYAGGYQTGYDAGRSETNWDDLAIVIREIVSSASAGDGVGGTDYGLIHYVRGLREGYWKGRQHGEDYYYY